MKNRRIHVVIIVATLVVAGIAVSTASFAGAGQKQRSKTERTVKMTDRPRPAESNASSAFSPAAARR